jgi:hypothetical protein
VIYSLRSSQLQQHSIAPARSKRMNSLKRNRSLADRVGKMLDATLIRILLIVILGYIGVFAALTSLLGKAVAAWIATPLLAICLLIIDRWDRSRVKKGFSWRELFKLPRFNYWNILWIVLAILISQAIGGVLIAMFEDSSCDSEDLKGCVVQDLTNTKSLIGMWISCVVSFFVAGYVAERLPNFKCYSPYRHALWASLLYISVSAIIMLPVIFTILDGPFDEESGFIIIGSLPTFLFAAVGVWVAKQISARGSTNRRVGSRLEPQLTLPPKTMLPSGYGKRRKRKRGKGRH